MEEQKDPMDFSGSVEFPETEKETDPMSRVSVFTVFMYVYNGLFDQSAFIDFELPAQ